MWGGLVAALSLYVGNASNYGDGGAYWAPNGSLTSEVAPVAESLLALGLRNEAAGIVAFYLDSFVRADGSLPECDACADGGFGDALADYGEMLEIFARTARAQLAFANESAWVAKRLPAFARMYKQTNALNFSTYLSPTAPPTDPSPHPAQSRAGLANYALQLRLNASSAGAPPGAPSHGLVYGSPEHDTCREPGYYFHNNAWLLRGIAEAAELLAEVGGADFAPLVAALAAEAPRFAADLNASLALVSVDLGGGLLWVPPIAAMLPPFGSMTESILASYTNFRCTWGEQINCPPFSHEGTA